jgi:hypothetical protein
MLTIPTTLNKRRKRHKAPPCVKQGGAFVLLRQHRTKIGDTSCGLFFRHIAQKSSLIHKVLARIFVLSDEKLSTQSDHRLLYGTALKQITMAAVSEQKEHQSVLFVSVNKQPVGSDMAFPVPLIITAQAVITIFQRQGYAVSKQINNGFQFINVIASLHCCSELSFESC